MLNNLRKFLREGVSHNELSLNSCFYLLSLAVVLATSAIKIAQADVCFLPDSKGCEMVPYEEYKCEGNDCPSDCANSTELSCDASYDLTTPKEGEGWACDDCDDADGKHYKCTAKQCQTGSSVSCVANECKTCVDKGYSGDNVCQESQDVAAHCPEGYVSDEPAGCYATENMLCGSGKCYMAVDAPECGEGKRLAIADGVCSCVCKEGYHADGGNCVKDTPDEEDDCGEWAYIFLKNSPYIVVDVETYLSDDDIEEFTSDEYGLGVASIYGAEDTYLCGKDYDIGMRVCKNATVTFKVEQEATHFYEHLGINDHMLNNYSFPGTKEFSFTLTDEFAKANGITQWHDNKEEFNNDFHYNEEYGINVASSACEYAIDECPTKEECERSHTSNSDKYRIECETDVDNGCYHAYVYDNTFHRCNELDAAYFHDIKNAVGHYGDGSYYSGLCFRESDRGIKVYMLAEKDWCGDGCMGLYKAGNGKLVTGYFAPEKIVDECDKSDYDPRNSDSRDHIYRVTETGVEKVDADLESNRFTYDGKQQFTYLSSKSTEIDDVWLSSWLTESAGVLTGKYGNSQVIYFYECYDTTYKCYGASHAPGYVDDGR